MKILISAFSCAPGRGSEPGLGWSVSVAVGRNHEVWVLLDEHNRPWVEQEGIARQEFRGTLVFVGLPWRLSRLFSPRWRGYFYYALWQLAAFLVARRLHRQIGFDLVHHVTYQNSWIPLWMGFLGIPFVWNAGCRETTPLRLLGCLSWRGRLSELTRFMVISASRRFSDCTTARRASVILSQSPAPHWPRGTHIAAVACGGLRPDEVDRLARIPPRRTRPFRVASVGRLIGAKGTGLALQAFARLVQESSDSEYWIIGDGPERDAVRRLARELGCAKQVRFLGWKSRAEVFTLLQQVDALLHPSFRDAFGYVIIEAMAAGRPVICLESTGPARILAHGGGIAVPLTSGREILHALHRALVLLANDPDLRYTLGERARSLALAKYHWTHQANLLETIYLQVIARHRSPTSRPRALLRVHSPSSPN